VDIGAWEYLVPGAPVPGAGSGDSDTSAPLAQIDGYVRDAREKPLEGVTVALAGGGTASTVTADANGFYRFTGLAQGIVYTITPSKTGYGFTPASINVESLGGNLSNQNFTGRRKLAVKGRVRDNTGAALQSAQVTLSGGTSSTVTTDGNGAFEFNDLLEGFSYSVKLAKSGYLFEPPVISTGFLAASIDAWDFLGANIAGAVKGSQVKVYGSSSGKGAINPGKGETARIYFHSESTGRFECRVFNLSGDLVWQSGMSDVQEGTFEWAPRSAASGIYVVHITGPGLTVKKKIALIR
jgi:hypothetical protein